MTSQSPSTREEAERRAALIGETIQNAWDSINSLPPIELSDGERRALGHAVLHRLAVASLLKEKNDV